MSIFTPFEKLYDLIKKAITNVEDHIPDYIAKGLYASTFLKTLLNDSRVVAIIDFTPTTIDNAVRDTLASAIQQAIELLQIGQHCGGDLDCWINSLKALPADAQDAILIKFAAKIVAILDNNQLKQREYDKQTQKAFNAIN